jgi:outer membrane protein assembly factor BamB
MRPLSAVLLLALGAPAQDPRDATGVRAGLAVHVGSSDGALEASLAGPFLVHGLALDRESRERARDALRARGLHPLASVETWAGPALPYGDTLVDLLVADLELLGARAPSEEEILRVLRPGGAAWLRKGGAWSKRAKPRPPELGEWTHFDHGPDANGVSPDRRIGVANFVQWSSGVQEIALGGNPAGFVGLTGVRVTADRAVFDYETGGKPRRAFLASRDAWNGVPLWTEPRDPKSAHRRWQLATVHDRIYTFEGEKLVALDAATGKPAFAFETSAPPLPEEGTQIRVGRERLVVNLADGLHAFDARSGRKLWTYAEEGRMLCFTSLSEETGRVFAVSAAPEQQLRSRWPAAVADAVVCLDLANGKPAWRSVEVAGKPVGQVIPSEGRVALFAGSAIGGRQKEGGWVAALDARDGRLLAQGTFASAWNDSMYNALVRDGAVWYAGHTSLYRFDPGTGTIERKVNLSYNQRCNRFTATCELWLTGYVTYLDRDFNGFLQSAARAGCALGTTPANGMVYLTPSACG